MPRYLVQRVFRDGFPFSMTEEGAAACRDIVARNADLGVTWLQSYVSDDERCMICLYEGSDPESIRKAAARNGLPVERIIRVSVLDPHFHR